jgi:citrate lyase subunit beta / citryl-CoA lyase
MQNYKTAIMINGFNEKHLSKLSSLEASIAVINLEDGVSAEQKPIALERTALAIENLKARSSLIVVRVNELGSSTIENEIKRLNIAKPDAIRVPKIKTVSDVVKALELIDIDIDLHLSIETAEALENLSSFGFDKRIKIVYLGVLDMLESLGLPQNLLRLDSPTIDYIIAKFLVSARTAGLYPVSFIYQDFKDEAGFRAWCEKEKAMGFTAKGCISPRQVAIANEVFGVDKAQIDRAKYIKEIFEAMRAQGETGFVDGRYGFIDEPIYKDALLVLKTVATSDDFKTS